MTNERIIQILEAHGMSYRVSNGRILAMNESWSVIKQCYEGKEQDITGISITGMRKFLNY